MFKDSVRVKASIASNGLEGGVFEVDIRTLASKNRLQTFCKVHVLKIWFEVDRHFTIVRFWLFQRSTEEFRREFVDIVNLISL